MPKLLKSVRICPVCGVGRIKRVGMRTCSRRCGALERCWGPGYKISNDDHDYGAREHEMARRALDKLRAEMAAERAWVDPRTRTMAEAEPHYAA